jgi:hypothetical protein
MKKFLIPLLLIIVSVAPLRAQQPKLVVVIVLDQFPYEYITRFQPYFGKSGFNYLLQNGANFTNARYGHANTKTAPGHAALITGTYSHINGIISNRWYDRTKKKAVNSVDDETVQLIGLQGIGRSPKNLLTPTLGDVLKKQTNFRSKIVSLSNKDRSAVLMGGKLGSAYWFEDSLLITSTYYSQQLPHWVDEFNRSGTIQKYFGSVWTERNPAAASRLCDIDDPPYEQSPTGLGRTFPHLVVGNSTTAITPSYYHIVQFTPYSTEILFAATEKACLAESLGMRGVADMLCVGISGTDEIGHIYGPMSHEVFDNALRVDTMLADFFSFLEKHVGLKNCIVALTSDHGIPPIPEYLKKRTPGIDAGRISSARINEMVTGVLNARYGKAPVGKQWLDQVIEAEVNISRDVLHTKELELNAVTQMLKDSLAHVAPFAAAFTHEELTRRDVSDSIGKMFQHAYNDERSADIIFALKPYYIISGGDPVGTNHGQPYEYDTHVPLVFVGERFRPGTYAEEASPIDLAVTLGEILGVEFPPDREGRVLKEALR